MPDHGRYGRLPAVINGLSGFRSAALAAVLVSAGCASVPPADDSETVAPSEPEPIMGETTPDQILSDLPDWAEELVLAEPDGSASNRLAAPAPGVEVEAFFGSWCSDSRRELTRLWRALDLAGGATGFPIRYIGVDRSKAEPAELVSGREILYVPTLIVSRGGRELGRIVESSPGGIESDLADLVGGRATGWLSKRDDLEPPAGGDGR